MPKVLVLFMKRIKLKRSDRKLAFLRLTINQVWSSQNLKFIAWSSTEAPFFTFFNQRQMVRRSVITFSSKTWRLSARKWRRKFAHGSKAHFHSIWNIVPESTFPIQQLISLFCQALCIEASRYEKMIQQFLWLDAGRKEYLFMNFWQKWEITRVFLFIFSV